MARTLTVARSKLTKLVHAKIAVVAAAAAAAAVDTAAVAAVAAAVVVAAEAVTNPAPVQNF